MSESSANVILYESPEAAKRVTVEGWMSANGEFYIDRPQHPGVAEHLARCVGLTHNKCGCGKLVHKSMFCMKCNMENLRRKYEALPVVEYDGGILTAYDDDEFWAGPEEFLEWCWDTKTNPLDVMLVPVNKCYLREVDEEYWYEEGPEEFSVPPALEAARKALNELIRTEGAFWWGGDCSKRVDVAKLVAGEKDHA